MVRPRAKRSLRRGLTVDLSNVDRRRLGLSAKCNRCLLRTWPLDHCRAPIQHRSTPKENRRGLGQWGSIATARATGGPGEAQKGWGTTETAPRLCSFWVVPVVDVRLDDDGGTSVGGGVGFGVGGALPPAGRCLLSSCASSALILARMSASSSDSAAAAAGAGAFRLTCFAGDRSGRTCPRVGSITGTRSRLTWIADVAGTGSATATMEWESISTDETTGDSAPHVFQGEWGRAPPTMMGRSIVLVHESEEVVHPVVHLVIVAHRGCLPCVVVVFNGLGANRRTEPVKNSASPYPRCPSASRKRGRPR